jgi:hypothetical protein
MSLPEDPRDIYVAGDPEEDHPRASKHRLVAETKRAVEAVALLDATEVDVDVLDALVDDMAGLVERVETLPDLRRRGGLALSGYPDSALMERSGISGRANPLAAPLHLEVGPDKTTGWAVWTDAYEGPPGCLHGGFVAAAFDDLLGLAQMASGTAGFTGTLTVRMRRPTPLNARIDYEAGVEKVSGRKITVWGKAWHGEDLLGEATILFITPRGGMDIDRMRDGA